MSKIKSKCFPNATQELLLKAALFQGEDAIVAWESWRKLVDFESLQDGSFRLLPKLYRNLSQLGVTDSWMGRCKGIYRKTWYENQLRLQCLGELCHQFQEAGIATLVFKGAALSLQDYQNCGVRPMQDIDILIPLEQVAKAETLLSEQGWKCDEKWVGLERLVRSKHAINFKDCRGQGIDLHWHLLHNCLQDDADTDFWKFAVTLENDRLSTLTLCPTDRLLCACIHGLYWDVTPSFRWIADAVTILQNNVTTIDWQRLLVTAQTHHLVIPLREALRYLHETFLASIPLAVFQTLENLKVSGLEQRLFEAGLRPFTQAPPDEMIIANRVASRVTEADLIQDEYPVESRFSRPKRDDGKIRLGILSSGFSRSSETTSIIEICDRLDLNQFEILLYAIDGDLQPSSVELDLQTKVDRLSLLPVNLMFYMPDEGKLLTSVETIRADNLDILLITCDLEKNTFARLLALHRLAPIQVASMFFPTLETFRHVDYYLFEENSDELKFNNSERYIPVNWQQLEMTLKQLWKRGEIASPKPPTPIEPSALPDRQDNEQKLKIYLDRIRSNLKELRKNPELFR
jgi:hypothetical protein